MKICIFDSISSIHCKRWLDILTKIYNDIYLLSFEKGEYEGVQIIPIDIPIIQYRLPIISTIFEINRKSNIIKNALKKINPDLIHANYATNYGFLAALNKKCKLILTTHGSDLNLDYHKNYHTKKMIDFSFKKADIVTVPSNYLYNKFLPIIGKNKIKEFQYGYDNLTFNLENKCDFTSPIILSTRHMFPKYHIDYLVETFSNVLNTYKNSSIKLKLAGIPQDKVKILDLMKKLNITKNVEIIGQLSSGKMSLEMKKSNIYVSTSPSEGLSISLLEAISSAMIPVVPNIPPNRQLIDQCNVGYLYNFNNAQDFKNKLLLAIDNLYRVDERISQAKKIQNYWGMHKRIKSFINSYYKKQT